MDSTLSLEWKIHNICRYCLKSQLYLKDISSDQHCSGQVEVYADMLKDTFDIQLSTEDGTSRLVCEGCISRLRDAASFKIKVQRSEESFLQCLKFSYSKDKKLPEAELKVEDLKAESPLDTEVDSKCDDSVDDDDEILANLKIEWTKCEDNVLKEAKGSKVSRKKENSKNAWSKLTDRRGNGPLLRENSLKLLANSTICVFQWNKSRYRCFCCKEPFSDMNLLKEHTESSHTLRDIEKIIISQQNRLVKVEISHVNCKQCALELGSVDDLRKHLVEIHDVRFNGEDLLIPFKIEPQLKCQICSERFTVFRHLNIHINKHFRRQVCHVCGAGFSNAVFLNLHKTRSHKRVDCKLCELTFETRAAKRKHDVVCHGVTNEKKYRFPCPYCSDRFRQENLRVQHLVDAHGMARPEFKCGVCEKIFITRSLCNNHVKGVHLKEKNQECDVCHNFFYSKSDVTRHKVTHTGEKRYSCEICLNLFATKDSLRRHSKRSHAH